MGKPGSSGRSAWIEGLAHLISDLREGIQAGEDDHTLAHRLLPGLDRALERRAAAAALGRLGGRARAEKLSPTRRAEIARQAAAARWGQRARES
jgi:hypothetical protein